MSTAKVVFLFLFCSFTAFSQTIYVNGSLPTNGDGTSWATAFNNLEDAITASNLPTNEIWVATGTYYPAKDRTGNSNPTNNRTKTFHINKNLKLYGGFFGNELNITDRIIGENPTILSGDLGVQDVETDNSFNVISITNLNSIDSTPDCVLDGFTIEKGFNNFSSAGITIFSGFQYDLIINGCIFSKNKANNSGGAFNISFSEQNSSFKITNTIFTENSSYEGGAVSITNAGYHDVVEIDNCIFAYNKANRGGAIYNDTSYYLTVNIYNSTFYKNEASDKGNAIYHFIDIFCRDPQGAFTKVYNSIFADIANNKEDIYVIGFFPDELGCTIVDSRMDVFLYNCLSLKDLTYYNPDYSHQTVTTINTLITNPLFTNESNPIGPDNKWRTADDGLKLKPCSPAINAGDNSFVPVEIATDIAGEPRIQLGTVDIGAYESNSNTLPTIAMENTSVTANQVGTTLYYNDCDKLIAKVVSPPASPGLIPIAGNTTAKVWNDPVPVNSLFVSRHYEITPQQNSLTATGRITLYFTQSEFDAYNDLPNHYYDLPATPDDEAGKYFLEVVKFSGVSSDNSGLPNTYPGNISIINPLDQDIIWNANENRWEISFNVTGFSGFFVRAILGLPLNLLSFSANHNNETTELTWKTANEVNTKSFDIERSEDGSKFIKIGTVASKNNLETNEYSFLDNQSNLQNSNILYYRLKMIDLDSKFTYSKIVAVSLDNNKSITISPNPTSGKAMLNLGSKIELLKTVATITNASGMEVKQFKINKLAEEIDLSALPKAVYLVKLVDGPVLKLIKE